MRLDHGSAIVTGRKSPLSLYDKSLATYDEGDAFDHASAVGFIEIFGLPLRVEAARHGAVGAQYGAAWSWTEPLLESPADERDRPGARNGLITELPAPSVARTWNMTCYERRLNGPKTASSRCL